MAEPVACRQRQLLVLEQMYNQGYITEEEYQSARNEDVFALIRENTSEDPEEEETSDVRYTYFQEAAIQQVQEDLAEKLNISEEAAFNQVIPWWSADLPVAGSIDSGYCGLRGG